MPAGYVIAESIRVGARLEGFPLTLVSIERDAVQGATSGQPSSWTMIHFAFPDHEAQRLADALAGVLDGAWYANFDADGHTFVIFPRRVMRYQRGDPAARDEAEAHARALGIPDAQLDW